MSHYRPDLQGLRAVAILLVVASHAGVTLFSGGYVGVDVFFVLSGYLISRILYEQLVSDGRIRYLTFLNRRLKRLLPALLTVVTVTVAGAWVLLSRYEFLELTRSSVYASTWTSNLYFLFSAVGYFDELRASDFFLHTWSLGVEEQFYLVWPLLLWGVFRLRRHDREFALVLLVVMVATAVASGLLTAHWMQTRPTWAFFMMPARAWQFSLGALAFLLIHPNVRFAWLVDRLGSGFLRAVLQWLGLGLIVLSAVLLNDQSPYPGWRALGPSVGSFLVILAGAEGVVLRGSFLSRRFFVWIGDRSYSLYLWHWPALGLLWTLNIFSRDQAAVLAVGAALALATVTYRFVELPFWKGRLSIFRPDWTIAVSIASIATVCLALITHEQSVREGQSQVELEQMAAFRSDLPAIYSHGCDSWYYSSDLNPCVYGNTGAKRSVVLFGDSIGAQWFSMLPAIFDLTQWRLVVLTKSSCAMVDEEYVYQRIGQVYRVCSDWRDDAIRFIQKLRPDYLFMGSASTYEFTRDQWVDGTSRVLDRLSMYVGMSFVIPGTPALSVDGPGCLTRMFGGVDARAGVVSERCIRILHEKDTSRRVAWHLHDAVGRFPNAKLLDLNDLVCPGRRCSAMSSKGVPVFRDTQHLTDTFVRAHSGHIRGVLLSQLGANQL